jgi:nicotinamide mononucleotide transporter
MHIFSTQNIIAEFLGYPVSLIELIATVSLIELIATISGLVSVYYAAKSSILTWSTGLVNEIAFMILFYQLHLYSDMLLQVYFMVATFYGWYYWGQKAPKEIGVLGFSQLLIYILITLGGTVLVALFMCKIHHILPSLFHTPASFPWVDAFVSVTSVVATVLLARKFLATWYFWIVVDLVSIGLYLVKGVHLIAIEYCVFLVLAIMGLIAWRKMINV